MAQSHLPEARWLSFTEIWIGQRKWNLTIREGMDEASVDAVLGLLQYASDKAEEMGASFRPQGEEFPSRQVDRDSGETHPQDEARTSNGADKGVWHVVRLEVGGTKEAPVVSMFDRNPKLQFPVSKVPSDLLVSILESTYGQGAFDSSIGKLSTCGEIIRVDWEVSWIQSPKNSKWRDISTIRIPKLERDNAK